MKSIHAALKNVTAGSPVSHESLAVYPLFANEPFEKDYLTLDEALAAGSATITEVSDAGSVPELLFRNRGAQAVFLLDGEELVGAKQNRILNLSILASAGKDTVIPVSCVEAGRWAHATPDFKAAPRAQFAASRAKRSAQVSESMASSGTRRSDQSEVWDDISVKLSSLGSRSDTQAVESAFADNESRLDDFVAKFAPAAGQAGGVFCIGGRVLGAELFDSPDTCRALLPKIIRSYALDAIDPRFAGDAENGLPAPGEFLERIAKAPCQEAESIGEGVDLRFGTESGLAGGALFARDRVVHLVAFDAPPRHPRSSGRVYRRPFRF